MSKPRVIKDFEKLTPEVVDQVKLAYPYGFTKSLISFKNREGKLQKALPFETEEFHYLIRMNEAKAEAIIRADIDYDIHGRLKENSRRRLEDAIGDEEEDDHLLDELEDIGEEASAAMESADAGDEL